MEYDMAGEEARRSAWCWKNIGRDRTRVFRGLGGRIGQSTLTGKAGLEE